MSQHWDPAPDSAEIEAATSRLLATAATLSDADVLAPSRLPEWSRGHVLTHIARNADSLVNLLTSAATAVPHPQYASKEARDTAIDAGAARPAAEQVADIEASHRRFEDAVSAMPPGGWQHDVRWLSGETRPATKILDARLREVAIHHIDLDGAYTASDWSSQFALRILVSVLPAFEVRGPASALAIWVLGRDDGSTLEVTGGQLPTPPAWT